MATDLRWVKREECVTENDQNIVRIVRVLQFRIKNRVADSDGFQYPDWSEWKDVPTVDELDMKPGHTP